jgi:hypothetical protein
MLNSYKPTLSGRRLQFGGNVWRKPRVILAVTVASIILAILVIRRFAREISKCLRCGSSGRVGDSPPRY